MFTVGRCGAPPLVVNATISTVENASVFAVNCFPGYRFPDGVTEKRIQCDDSGAWTDIDQCKCMYEIPINIMSIIIIMSSRGRNL